MGGPIKRNKLFFFTAATNQTDDREAAFYIATVPTAAIKSGNMQGSSESDLRSQTGHSNGRGRTPFPNQTLPAARIDPIAAKLAAMTPLPNLAGIC